MVYQECKNRDVIWVNLAGYPAKEQPKDAIVYQSDVPFEYRKQEKLQKSYEEQECVNTFTQAKLEEYAAILMDIRMPVMDEIQATKVIRGSNRKDAGTIPIIAMTANAFEQDVRDCMADGMNAHLSKPIVPELLYQTLRQFVKV